MDQNPDYGCQEDDAAGPNQDGHAQPVRSHVQAHAEEDTSAGN